MSHWYPLKCIIWGKIPVSFPKKWLRFKTTANKERKMYLRSRESRVRAGDPKKKVGQCEMCLCWMLRGKSNPTSVRQLSPESRSTRLLSYTLSFASLPLNLLSAALCEENTRCCMWSLILATRCHGNTNQTAACTSGAGGKREREGREWEDGVGSGKLSI